MEVAALAALLGLGYALTRARPTEKQEEVEEGFDPQGLAEIFPDGGMPPPLYPQDRTPGDQATIPGKPRMTTRLADGELDLYYDLPSGETVTTGTDPDLYRRTLTYSTPANSLTPQAPPTSVTAQVRMNNSGDEAPPVYNSGKTVISSLTGIAMPAEEFTHANMTPFYRGSLKQNMSDSSNRHALDDMVGAGSTIISKREQAPMFDPHRGIVGNVNGLESSTDFMQDRMVVSTNRANEVPVEPMRVGPGLNQGYTPFGTGGFQQMDVNEIMRGFKSIDETRVESNPRITYSAPVVPGKSIALQRGDIGEVRKYQPDSFYINENGERNFVTAGENTKPMQHAAQVFKFQSRTETSSEVMGPATAADFKQTYTVPSFRAPFARQQDGFGFRNTDGSSYGVKNTDAENNDFGKANYELFTNQRNVISERGQALNLTVADGPKALTVYDPNDIARTTIRESTAANDHVGIAGLAGVPQKLTVYDPTDITRITTRNVNYEPDHALNVTRAGAPSQLTLLYPDGVRNTTKSVISAESDYKGSAGPAIQAAEQVYDYAYASRTNPTKEVVSKLRKPIAGNGNLPIFNGEDYVNMSIRRPDMDAVNERSNVSDRVIGPPLGTEAIGIQRPPQELMMDISVERNIHEILDSLDDNPYALPLFKIAQNAPKAKAIHAVPGGILQGVPHHAVPQRFEGFEARLQGSASRPATSYAGAGPRMHGPAEMAAWN
jgi:hypothetical protein